MCCFRLHFFLILMCYLKKNKNLLQFTFEKNREVKREKKISCHEKKSQPPPPPPPPPNIKWSVPYVQFTSKINVYDKK